MNKIVIIGAGHAGGSFSALLLQYGFEGGILLAGEEPVAPYQRPPLSKAWLNGDADLDALLLRPDSFYALHKIELRAPPEFMAGKALIGKRAAVDVDKLADTGVSMKQVGREP